MASVVFRYSALIPPGPTALVTLQPREGTSSLSDLPALIDTGADQTVVPSRFIEALAIVPSGSANVIGFDGAMQRLATYPVKLQIKRLSAIDVIAIESPLITHIILGRDVLNHYAINLDGPNQRVEIVEPGNELP